MFIFRLPLSRNVLSVTVLAQATCCLYDESQKKKFIHSFIWSLDLLSLTIMQPSTPFPGGYVPSAGPFAMQGAVGAAPSTMTMTGPMQGGPANATGTMAGRRRGFQHGSGAGAARSDNNKRGRLYRSHTRGRSRDRSGSHEARQPSMTPAGPQTAMDWEEIADNLARRVNQLEQRLQNVTQVVAGHTTTLEAYREGCAQLTVKVENNVTNINGLTERVSNLTGSAQFEVQGINDKLKLLEGMIQSLTQNYANAGGPVNYNIGSPDTDAPDDFATQYPSADPSQRVRFAMPGGPPPGVPLGTPQPQPSQAQQQVQPPQERPLSPQEADAIYQRGLRERLAQDQQRFPPQYEHPRQQWNRQDDGAPGQAYYPADYGFVQGAPDVCRMFLGGVRAFRISRKGMDKLPTFNGSMEKFAYWKSKVIDHLVESNHRWKEILKVTETANRPITRGYLESLHVGFGDTAWPIAVDLESFLAKVFGETMYGRRRGLCGGTDEEEGNGLRMWQQLYEEFEGGSSIVQYAARRALNNWPRCTKIDDLHQHLDDWVACLMKHGRDLLGNHEELYHRCLEIIPTSLEEEIINNQIEITTYREIVDFCKRRTLRARAMAQARLASNQGPRRKVHAVTPQAEPENPLMQTTPSQINELVIAAVKAATAGPKNGSSGPNGARTPPRGRSTSPSGEKDRPPPFRYPDDECMECGSKAHRRADCPIFKKVLEGNNGKWPKGHKGKFEKARDAHRKKYGNRSGSRDRRSQSPRSHTKAVTHEAGNLSDSSESSFEGTSRIAGVMTNVFAVKPNFCDGFMKAKKTFRAPKDCACRQTEFTEANLFNSLSDEDPPHALIDSSDTEPEAVTDPMNTWARRIKSRKQAKKLPKTEREYACTTERNLDLLMKAEPTLIAALPRTTKGINKLAKRCPSDEELGPDEFYMMMDSGSGSNGAKCKSLFPKYKVHGHTKDRPQQNCITACGTPLEHRGHCNLNVEIGGEDHILPMDDLDVDVPILSVRRIVRRGNLVKFRRGGGYIQNARTGRKLPFIERQGVYFIKVKVKNPNPTASIGESVFSRQGR